VGATAFVAACGYGLCCDIRTAADTAGLSMHPIRDGTAYQFEGIQRFINVVGLARTKELFLTANPVSA
jgi:enoyl-CoA hydratase/carnithine racemase